MFRKDGGEERQNYAVFSELAYKNPNQIENDNIPENFTIDKDLSDRNRKVFYNPTTKEVVVSERGTELKDKKNRYKDIQSDALLFLGLENYDPRVKQSKRKLNAIADKYSDADITYTGHSLGGQVASVVAKDKRVKKAITYNKGFSPLSDRGTGKATNYYTQGDLISNVGALLSKGKNVVERSSKKNKHAINTFTS